MTIENNSTSEQSPSALTTKIGAAGRKNGRFSKIATRNLTSVFTLLLVLNVISWGLLWRLGSSYPVLISLGVLAYGFGLRHAVDADHIAAIDNITRKLLQEQKNPSRVGMYFSFGHSTIVFILSLAIVFAVQGVQHNLPQLASVGAWIGTAVSAGFLFLIGTMNFTVFRSLWRRWRQERSESGAVRFTLSTSSSRSHSPVNNTAKTGRPIDTIEVKDIHDDEHDDELLWKRGFLTRLLRRPLKLVEHAWQTYFIGLLFGLGFDTATEVGLLGISGSAVNRGMPPVDILVLPILFAAGMSLIDGIDGVVMMYAYNWAARGTGSRLIYNLVITGVSVVVAVIVGTFECVHIIF